MLICPCPRWDLPMPAQRRSAKKSHPGQIPLNSKAAQPPAQCSPCQVLSNTRHERYPLTGFGGKRIPGSYFFCNKHDIVWENMIFCYIDDMIVIRCYKYTVCSSCYLSTHSFKVRWECLAKKPKAICFHCFKDKSVNNCKQQKLQSLFSLFKSITHLLKISGSIS